MDGKQAQDSDDQRVRTIDVCSMQHDSSRVIYAQERQNQGSRIDGAPGFLQISAKLPVHNGCMITQGTGNESMGKGLKRYLLTGPNMRNALNGLERHAMIILKKEVCLNLTGDGSDEHEWGELE
jgi:hypothetical protein